MLKCNTAVQFVQHCYIVLLTVVHIIDNDGKPARMSLERRQAAAHFIKSYSVVGAFCNFVQQLAVC